MTKSIVVFAFLAIAVSFSSNAQDSDRTGRLEKEVQELKARVAKLESMLSVQGNVQELVTSADGWKSVANWRKLSTKMSPNDVRKLLGEPDRIDGGGVAIWHYSNRGRFTFISDKVTSWTEPGN